MKTHVEGGVAYDPNHEQFPCESHVSKKKEQMQ